MYWKLFREGVAKRFPGRRRRRWMGAAMAAALVFVVVASVLIVDSRKGRRDASASMDGGREGQVSAGSQDPIVLTRGVVGDGAAQFTSATLLPGHGMGVTQITAFLPGKGEVKLLADGERADGAFLAPWAGRLGGLVGGDGTISAVTWRGRTFGLRSNDMGHEAPAAYGGLLLNAVASGVEVSPMPDGETVSAMLLSDGLGGGWPSQTETRVSVRLASRAMELSVLVKNTGEEATPVGVGWAPRFLLPGGEREKVMLRVPASMREVTEQNGSGMPTGELDRVKGTAYDFNALGGVALGRYGLDDTFVHLETGAEGHPAIELRDPGGKFGLRMVVLSETVKAVQVRSPENAGFVSISPQMNYDDPFGGEWKMSEDTGMVVLQPGQTVEWKVRLELFSL